MNVDIHSAVVTVIVVAVLGAFLSIWSGISAFQKGNKVSYYRLKRIQISTGWRAFAVAVLLIAFAFMVGRFGEPISYKFFPPSPTRSPTTTVSMTFTISLTPTISLPPTITPTPAISYSPTTTGTPFLPITIETQFKSIVTPSSAAIFSQLVFSLKVNNFQAVEPQTIFQNPLSSVFVTYTYDGMLDGVQWTEIWYLNGNLLKYDTSIWNHGTGGSGQDVLSLPAEEWSPGIYQLVFYVGTNWKALGEFRVTGTPPTATVTSTPSKTGTPTFTPSLTHTLYPSSTPIPTDTRWPSPTPEEENIN
jgi:hypothetical protein